VIVERGFAAEERRHFRHLTRVPIIDLSVLLYNKRSLVAPPLPRVSCPDLLPHRDSVTIRKIRSPRDSNTVRIPFEPSARIMWHRLWTSCNKEPSAYNTIPKRYCVFLVFSLIFSRNWKRFRSSSEPSGRREENKKEFGDLSIPMG
jgi:hypothetical protein